MRKFRKKITLFALVGVIVTAIHFGVLILFVEGFAVSPTLGTLAGSLVAVVASYFLNYRLTFDSNKPHIEAGPKFIIVTLIGMLGNTAIMHFGSSIMSWPYVWVQCVATAIILFWNFFGNYLWAFRTGTPS